MRTQQLTNWDKFDIRVKLQLFFLIYSVGIDLVTAENYILKYSTTVYQTMMKQSGILPFREKIMRKRLII